MFNHQIIFSQKGFIYNFVIHAVFMLFALNVNAQQVADSGMMVSGYNHPVSLVKIADKHYFIDFGKHFFGSLAIVSDTDTYLNLDIHLGEALSKPNTINRNPGGTIRFQSVVFNDSLKAGEKHIVKLQANKRNTSGAAILLPDSFGVIMPFRYCEIEGVDLEAKNLSFKQNYFHYVFNESASSFTSSDTILNQVWDMCKHTIKATSFAGVYIDGDRERIPYEADAYLNQLSHYCLDSEYQMARKTNEYFINNPTWPTEWILHTVIMFYEDYLYTGDIEPLRKHYESLKHKTLMDARRRDGLISSQLITPEIIKNCGFKNPNTKVRDIVDWPMSERDNYDMRPINTVVNAFYYKNLDLMARIAQMLNKRNDMKFFLSEKKKVFNNFNETFFDNEKGIYRDGEFSNHHSLHANLFPLAFGLVEESRVKDVVEYIKSRGMACSVYAAQYLLDALYDSREAEYAFSLLVSTDTRSWWNMIRTGSTMTMEAWDMKFKPNSDWNHAWATAPANIVARKMWGIMPGTPGFKTVHIRPQLNGLTYSDIRIPTINGAVEASMRIVDNKNESYKFYLPENVRGILFLDHFNNHNVIINNKVLKKLPKKGIKINGNVSVLLIRNDL